MVLTEVYSPPFRIWGMWGSHYNIPKAIFYLLKGGLYIQLHTKGTHDMKNQMEAGPA